MCCHFDADLDPDLDPAFRFDANPDPTFHFGADPDPVPNFQIKAQNLKKVLKQAHIPYFQACYLQIDADLDPASQFDANPDPALQFDAHPDPQHGLTVNNI